MKGWTKPIQRASFRGVRFEVLSVDDDFYRSTIEHAYPFVNGADVEDLGLNPLTVRMQAIFYGDGYYTDFKRFLSVLEKQGAATLVHPIRGRLQNMICTGANFRHEADMIDYVALDLTFIESTPAKPIFIFNHSLLAKIDTLLSELEDFTDDVMALYSEFLEIVAFGANVKSRLQGVYGALFGCFEQIRHLFDFDKTRYAVSPVVTKENFKAKAAHSVRDLVMMIDSGLHQIATRQDLTTKAKFDEVMRTIRQIKTIPADLVSGKNIKSAKEQAVLKSLTTSFSKTDTESVHLVMQLAVSSVLLRIATELVEDDELLPQDIDYITTKVRSQIVENLHLLRTQTNKEYQGHREHQGENVAVSATLTTPNTGFYTAAHNTAEQLRNKAHKFTQLALAAINRKPPLMVREVPITGTIQQIAHEFYSDYKRADELLRLNPQIRYPNLIERGEWLNSYVK
ncbi:DNA circularization protein [Rodentibacter trehalosifermentans]|uniref:Phage morphogenesis protein n=1 Tax=Rodentibacter trehalosifermentans TaxID=1908263 RepID=A0A1V3IUK5_9PAST|nr:DNA circularization N-terminal domain-containing protein [Rodentibacter trehalosifermentans]OOF45609.1 phage morphogenesis protein [Rodentibacter trehalosifermentans]OOF47532.1 phage morphogenesis protein [Rodentibacter trehalosifermentans]